MAPAWGCAAHKEECTSAHRDTAERVHRAARRPRTHAPHHTAYYRTAMNNSHNSGAATAPARSAHARERPQRRTLRPVPWLARRRRSPCHPHGAVPPCDMRSLLVTRQQGFRRAGAFERPAKNSADDKFKSRQVATSALHAKHAFIAGAMEHALFPHGISGATSHNSTVAHSNSNPPACRTPRMGRGAAA